MYNIFQQDRLRTHYTNDSNWENPRRMFPRNIIRNGESERQQNKFNLFITYGWSVYLIHFVYLSFFLFKSRRHFQFLSIQKIEYICMYLFILLSTGSETVISCEFIQTRRIRLCRTYACHMLCYIEFFT